MVGVCYDGTLKLDLKRGGRELSLVPAEGLAVLRARGGGRRSLSERIHRATGSGDYKCGATWIGDGEASPKRHFELNICCIGGNQLMVYWGYWTSRLASLLNGRRGILISSGETH